MSLTLKKGLSWGSLIFTSRAILKSCLHSLSFIFVSVSYGPGSPNSVNRPIYRSKAQWTEHVTHLMGTQSMYTKLLCGTEIFRYSLRTGPANCGNMDWNGLAHDTVHWRALVTTTMVFRIRFLSR